MNTKFKHYVRQTLRNADDIDATVAQLWQEHKSEEALNLITDLYVLQKEQNLGNHKEKQKECYYEVCYSGQKKKSQWEIASKIMDNRLLD